MKDSDEQNSQLRKGLLEMAVLLVISNGPVYASDILKKLTTNYLLIVEGTLYPLLSRLKKDGSLNYKWRESKNGPPRKYYQLTEIGNKKLAQKLAAWKKLNKSINALITK